MRHHNKCILCEVQRGANRQNVLRFTRLDLSTFQIPECDLGSLWTQNFVSPGWRCIAMWRLLDVTKAGSYCLDLTEGVRVTWPPKTLPAGTGILQTIREKFDSRMVLVSTQRSRIFLLSFGGSWQLLVSTMFRDKNPYI